MAAALQRLAWRDPVEVMAAFAEEPFALLLLSGGGSAQARWSYLLRAPLRTMLFDPAEAGDPVAALARLAATDEPADPDGPPFQGGVAGLLGYDLATRLEPGVITADPHWPLVAAGRYEALLAFDHERREVVAVGRGEDAAAAETRCDTAAGWLRTEAPTARGGRLCADLASLTSAGTYEAAVAEVTERIAAGEFFQANMARRWAGRLGEGRTPFDLIRRLAQRAPAPFAGYLRLPGRALVSNSPERFVQLTPGEGGPVAETRPIKGTRARGVSCGTDRAAAAELAASAKDRAENLMIVDLMRNDLARVCAPGSVAVPQLFGVESLPNVHHLVSVVTGRLRAGAAWPDLIRAAFPPGSITGAPKVEAMRRIAALEPPRGPFFGSLFWAGDDGAFDSSVLIRTAAFAQDDAGWSVELRAGAGLVADSDPAAERAETEVKAALLRAALTEDGA